MTTREKQASKRLQTALKKVKKSVSDVQAAAKKLQDAHKAASKTVKRKKPRRKTTAKRAKRTVRRPARRKSARKTARRKAPSGKSEAQPRMTMRTRSDNASATSVSILRLSAHRRLPNQKPPSLQFLKKAGRGQRR